MSTVQRKSPARWVHRRSESDEFTHAWFVTDAKGDYVRVDSDIKKGRVRLLIEDRSERRFYSLIEKGIILKEWASRGSSSGIKKLFTSKSNILSTLPNAAVVAICKPCYGIGKIKNSHIRHQEREQPNKKMKLTLGVLIAVLIIVLLVAALSFYYR